MPKFLPHNTIDIVLTRATGADAGIPQRLSGYRVSLTSKTAGGYGMSELSVRIYGMPLSQMNEFSRFGTTPMTFNGDTVMVLASNDSGSMSKVFEGTMVNACQDYSAAPDVAFIITALGGLIQALQPASPSSFPGTVDAADVLEGLAKQGGLNFENNGVSVQLSRPYYSGALRTQILECIEDAGINGVIEDGTLAIWPAGGVRAGTIAVISPSTGMVGYPAPTNVGGALVNSLFNPGLRFGARVQVEGSTIPQANGAWDVITVTHDLESEVPGGKWITQVELVAPGLIVMPTK